MQIIVIGAGASGMMAAITAARAGCKVTILEHTGKIGRKIEITGNGKCNFTNSNQKPKFYRTESIQAVKLVLDHFTYTDTITFFKELGIYPKDKNGYYYPVSGQAAAVGDVLRMEAEHLKVKFACNIHVLSIKKVENKIVVQTQGYDYTADALILATGSKAAPSTGSDGSGYELAKQLGHTMIKPLPALVQLGTKDKRIQNLAGLRAGAKVILRVEGNVIAEDVGEVQFTQGAISGIPVFQVSRYAVRAMDEKKNVTAEFNFMPELEKKEFEQYVKQRVPLGMYKTIQQFWTGLFHKKLTRVLLDSAELDVNKKLTEISEQEWQLLIDIITCFKVEISGCSSFEQAQACSGGIPFSEIDTPSLESKIIKGIYFAGEILDVDGACGGYNLQWAWASGYCAGLHAAKG